MHWKGLLVGTAARTRPISSTRVRSSVRAEREQQALLNFYLLLTLSYLDLAAAAALRSLAALRNTRKFEYPSAKIPVLQT